MSGKTLRIWGLGTSRTLRPIWLLHELGLPFEIEPILTRSEAMETPAFRAISPRHKIPILQDGDFVLGESAAIVLYLADRYRGHGVFAPQPGSRERARHDELCWFSMTELAALLYTIRRHEGLPEVYGESPVAIAAARDYYLRSLGEFERRLADGRAHLLGDAFTVADLIFKTCLDWAAIVCRIPIPEVFGDYVGRLVARPAFGEAMKANFPPEAMAAITGAATR